RERSWTGAPNRSASDFVTLRSKPILCVCCRRRTLRRRIFLLLSKVFWGDNGCRSKSTFRFLERLVPMLRLLVCWERYLVSFAHFTGSLAILNRVARRFPPALPKPLSRPLWVSSSPFRP